MVGTAPALQAIKPEEAKDGYNFLLKGVIIGDSGVGKTALLNRFTNDTFNPVYIETLGIDFAVKSYRSHDGNNLKVQMWDTAGQERFRSVTNSYYRGCHGIIIVFDVGDVESFENVEFRLLEVKRYTSEDTPMILVGNKTDIGDNRQVSREKAENFAKEKGVKYVETSAKDNEYVDFAFQAFIEAMLEFQKKRRAEASEKPMTKALEKKMKKQQQSTSSESKSKGQTKSSTCTII